MEEYNIELGNTIRKYRNVKKYSTQQLAKLLGVSVGTINHLEHDKNNVFKLDLLLKLVKTLNIPLEEIFSTNIIEVNKIRQGKNTIQVVFCYEGLENAESIINEVEKIINSYIKCALQYKVNKEAMILITSTLLNEIELCRQLKSLTVV